MFLMSKENFLLTWPNKKHKRRFAAVYFKRIILLLYISFSKDVSCAHTFYSLMLLFDGYIGYADRNEYGIFPSIFTQTLHLGDLLP